MVKTGGGMPGEGLQLKQEGWSRKRWVRLGAASVLVVAGAAAGLLTVYTHSPIFASWVSIAAIGWTLCHFAGASVPGAALWVAAAAMLSVAVWTPISPDDFLVPTGALFALGGFLLSLPAGVLFLLASVKNRSRCAGNCAGCMIVLFAVVIYWVSGSTMRGYLVGPQCVQQTRQLILTLHQLAAEIEVFRTQRGRIPKDEAELVALRGKPMPPYYREYRVSYIRDDSDSYRLECGASHFWGRHWDLFPWIFSFHGPDAAQRLHVEAF